MEKQFFFDFFTHLVAIGLYWNSDKYWGFIDRDGSAVEQLIGCSRWNGPEGGTTWNFNILSLMITFEIERKSSLE